MALVSHILGDCPGCGAKDKFGIIDIYGHYVALGCWKCRYSEKRALPPVKKKVLYLDQLFFSHAVRGNEAQFVKAAELIAELAELQLLVTPYSNVHEDETHLADGHEEKLLEFIKRTSRYYSFSAAYTVEQNQLNSAFDAWLKGEPSAFVVKREQAIHDEIDIWDAYFSIQVGGYHGDIDLIRSLKGQAIQGLVDLFPDWRKSSNTFAQNLAVELNGAARGYLEAFAKYIQSILDEDFEAYINPPIIATVIQNLTHRFPPEVPKEERLGRVKEFLVSEHFKAVPYHDIEARMYATLKSMVKGGSYINPEKSVEKLSGFYFDVKHIATYAPYCDAFLMDKPMAEIVGRETVGLTQRYGTKVFSRNNWDEFIGWLESLKAGLTPEHRAGLEMAYPGIVIPNP